MTSREANNRTNVDAHFSDVVLGFMLPTALSTMSRIRQPSRPSACEEDLVQTAIAIVGDRAFKSERVRAPSTGRLSTCT